MEILKFIIVTLSALIIQLIAPFLLLLVLPFRKACGTSLLGHTQYRLPRGFRFLETPDEYLPGDLTLLTVRNIYDSFGEFWASWYWLGLRNTGFGFSWLFGKPATGYLVNLTTEEKALQGVYGHVYYTGKIKILVGYAIYRDWYSVYTDKGYWAVPRISLRMRSQK